MSEHSFIAFSMKILAVAQAPCQAPLPPLTHHANSLCFLMLRITGSAFLSPLPELGTCRDIHRGLPQYSCPFGLSCWSPWQRPTPGTSLTPTRPCGSRKGPDLEFLGLIKGMAYGETRLRMTQLGVKRRTGVL